jgi:hypothetical protein
MNSTASLLTVVLSCALALIVVAIVVRVGPQREAN